MKKQIYIVDDDDSVRRSLKLLTMAYGFAAETFCSAEEFFRSVLDSMPGCLILDVYMPGLNGWDAQKLIRKSSNRSVIMISAEKDDDFKERAFNEGAAGFLQKPFNDDELIALVNQAFLNKGREQ